MMLGKKNDCKQQKQCWIPDKQLTNDCGTFETKDKTYIVSRSQTVPFMGYCADCDKLEYLHTTVTHHGIEKNVCLDCLKHYSLCSTEIKRPRWAGVFL